MVKRVSMSKFSETSQRSGARLGIAPARNFGRDWVTAGDTTRVKRRLPENIIAGVLTCSWQCRADTRSRALLNKTLCIPGSQQDLKQSPSTLRAVTMHL